MSQSTINNNEQDAASVECLTIISPLANATIFEFHRQRLAKQGYLLSSKVQLHRFELVDEEAVKTQLFDGKAYYSATYIKSTNS